MLSVKNIVVYYGGVQALKGISLEIQESTITGLIGSNGAGKSTTLRAISGLVPISSGEIWFGKRRIDGRAPERIVSLGIVQVPEGKRLFLEMTVLDNLLAGAYLRKDTEKLGRDLERIFAYFPVLKRARNRFASQLSGGEQQMLAIGRGLMANPKMLLLDEPSLGLSPLLTKEVADIIKRIADEGVSILLIEQNANLAFQLVRKIYVMETGTITLEGDPSELQNDPHIREAYLGLAPTEEIQIGGLPTRSPTIISYDATKQERWQDKIPQMRFQDRVSEEKWQDKFAGQGKIDRDRPTVPVWNVGGSGRERSQQSPDEFAQAMGEKPMKLDRTVEAWSGMRRSGERWPSEKQENLQYGAKNLSEDRWDTVRRREMLGKKTSVFERWTEVGRLGQKKLPVRVIKKTIVPVVQNPRKGKDTAKE